ncbi:hypothetical protein QFC21_006068 [Naganishia friedmannii]|uniref:Uncharacterized protein n=1 Tax=Naganishia friedmannii TaxID=89922 RepID=A0ACC2V5G6_9TREE|nr:hypothetical protein QFC21_006068 [Naganishia friedmannii]
MPEIAGFDLSSSQTILLTLPLLYFLIPYILSLLTPKPLSGIPYRKNRQYPIIGDGLDAGKWLNEQTTITQWFDGVIMAFMYTGAEKGSEWGVLGGKDGRTAKQMMNDFEAEDLKRSKGWEGMCQMMFGLGNGARQVVVTDVHVLPYASPSHSKSVSAFLTLPYFEDQRLQWYSATRTDRVENRCDVEITAANNLVKLWHLKVEKMADGQFFESSEDLMDAITDIAFGKGYNLLPEYIDSLSSTTSPSANPTSSEHELIFPYDPNAMYHATEGLLNTLPLFSAFPKISIFLQSFQPKFRRDKQLVHAFICEQIKKARERSIARGDERAEMADCAVDQALLKDGTVDALSEPELRDEVLLFLAAGQETTARTLSWGMKMLARAPEVQKKLKKELTDAGLMEREMTYHDLLAEKVPYLEATANEILRLAGTAAGVSRIATRDTTVLGKHIPQGTTLYFPLTLISTLPMEHLAGDPNAVGARDAKWPGATLKMFEPERWLNDEGVFDSSVGVQSLPFSAGQRGCFGKALAILELKTMLAKNNLAFFLDPIPAEYDSDEFEEYVSRKPKVAYVRPVPW